MRRVDVRGLGVAADGAVTLFASFRSGRDTAIADIDATKLRVERGGQLLPGALTPRARPATMSTDFTVAPVMSWAPRSRAAGT